MMNALASPARKRMARNAHRLSAKPMAAARIPEAASQTSMIGRSRPEAQPPAPSTAPSRYPM